MGWGVFSGIQDAVGNVADPIVNAVSSVAAPVVDTASSLVNTAGNIGQSVINNPIPAALALGTGNVAPLLSYAITPQSTSGNSMAVSDLFSGLLSGIGGYLQNQSNVAGNQTAAQASQFRPVGITSRFGSSNFQINPDTGQMQSAGYSLSPELVGYQNRLSSLTGQGLTQAEQAQGQYAPLQQGAQSLFNLGNQYLAQSPQAAAQQYMTNQQALLAPSRNMESARLANQLQQTGRTGVQVAQGGSLGMANPEQQALANARAMQDLQLAANAQQAGQQQTSFGAGLLGQGASSLGNYYSGQQAAYAPFTTALGQTNALEQLGQQPFALSSELAGRSSTAGAKAADYLKSAGQANPLASILTGAGTNAALGTGLSGLGSTLSGLWDSWSNPITVDTSGAGLGSWGGIDTSLYGGAGGVSIR